MATRKRSDQYPHLTAIVNAIAEDNAIHQKPREKWLWPENVLELEEQASRLNDEQKEAFAIGEEREGQALCREYKLTELWEFCCEVFEGSLRTNFYKW